MRASTLVFVLAAACVEQTVIPRGGVPTFDDPGSDNYIAVSGGLEHTCALAADGAAYCWGSNEFGQLGAVADTTCAREERRIACARRPVPVSGGLAFMKISAGGKHTCGIATNSRIYCWGDNFRGELGDPSVRSSTAPIPILGSAAFVDVVTGEEHSCGLRADGLAFCWGANEEGQLGIASSGLGSASPDSVRTTLRFASLAAGGQRTCGRTGDGAAFCWGATWVASVNGEDVVRPQVNPLRVLPAPPFKSLAVGTHTTCGIAALSQNSEENSAYCWEANPAGGVGNGSVAGSLSPRLVEGFRFVAVSSGAFQTCGIADTGFAYCWGGDSFGQLGLAPVFLSNRCGAALMPCTTRPIRVSGWRVFSHISAGQGNHTCGLTLSGNIYCWGAGDMGQRGDGTASFGEWAPTKTARPDPL